MFAPEDSLKAAWGLVLLHLQWGVRNWSTASYCCDRTG